MKVEWNPRFREIDDTYLFAKTAALARACAAKHPERRVISLGIGDVTRPLPSVAVNAMMNAAREMGEEPSFRGYPPDGGYPFLRAAISAHYRRFGAQVSVDDIFASDGTKSDLGNFYDILGSTPVLLSNPVYPVWRDAGILAGASIGFLTGRPENGFLPTPEGLPDRPFVICLCSPNNPTGSAFTYDGLGAWVSFARRTGSLILMDAAYSAFVGRGMPRTVYEIEGAETCAVEFGSFSKMAGFTGVRCSWTVVPHALDGGIPRALGARRQSTKFNGVGYITARGAEAVLSDGGRVQCNANIAYYRENAGMLTDLLTQKGIPFTGGKHAPYVWFRTPRGTSSMQAFTYLLEEAGVVSTPGSGFGEAGEGYLRLTAFASHADTQEAVSRLQTVLC